MANYSAEFPKYRKWAVVGVSEDREKYGNKIYRDLRNAGYQVFAINPKLETVEGDPCYSSVKSLPETPDVVDLVVPPQASAKVVDDCLAAGIKRIWFQPGSESEEAIQKAQDGGMEVVYDACIMIQKQAWV
ncbi:MAG: CoA-binding protein [Vampirovibrio sp.]|jgi:predicted CoA-binding protein|nr:CoA-binding protein [Vampirovibrio sp.]